MHGLSVENAVKFTVVSRQNGDCGAIGSLRAKGVEVLMVWEGTRYRNSEEDKTFKTDANGMVKLPLSQAGRFLLEISHKQDVNFSNGITAKYQSLKMAKNQQH